jgi:hypothetical protein
MRNTNNNSSSLKGTNNMTRKIIATNNLGQQLVAGSWWSITKPIPEPTVAQNVVYHVGKEKYIRRIWDKQFKD